MKQLADDPIVRCMEETGYPPWMRLDWEDDEEWEEDDDVFYGNQTDDF